MHNFCGLSPCIHLSVSLGASYLHFKKTASSKVINYYNRKPWQLITVADGKTNHKYESGSEHTHAQMVI
jgi:hypothetical protein